MFRLLPWSSAIGGNKVMAEEVTMLATPSSNCSMPGVNGLSLPRLKRKRSDSDAATDAPAPTRPRTQPPVANTLPPAPVSQPVVSKPLASPLVAPSTPVASAHPPAQVAATGAPDVNQLRDTITAQLSLEVLLKHNELRLIDQEIAKCQVALEQLRRCAEIPYPGSLATGMSSTVSSGVGASVLVPGKGPAPISPAPWGVTEGPYSRHYARWLLPDPRFDGGEVDPGLASIGANGFPQVEGRSTRGNPVDMGSLASKTRPQRGSASAKLQSLPSGYPLIKEKAGPMLIRRKSDGVLVKLICLDCRRDNFSSTQGFINHCRIAHNRNFASHDAAAMASGEPVEVDEAGTVIGGRSESTSAPVAPGYVHPLIRSTQLPSPSNSLTTPAKDSVTPQRPSDMNAAATVATPPATRPSVREQRRQTEPAKISVNPSFLASPATPHLSALMRDRGVGVDMDQLVADAKTPVYLDGLSDSEDDMDTDDSGRPSDSGLEASQLGARAGRQPMRMPTAQAASQRSEGHKGLNRNPHDAQSLEESTPSRPPHHLQPSYLSEISLSDTPQAIQPREADHMSHPANLSPNTLESNQAPSLVSDDEDDFEAGSESDGPSSSEAGDHDQDIGHIEVEGDERTATPSTATTEAKPGPSLASPAPSAPPKLSKPLKRSRSKKNIPSMMPAFDDSDKEDKHVSFVHSDENPKSKRGPKPAPSGR
ncbi:hypothetical protein N7510_007532 [Penicillium lagena]|uniref:uncharacterized protein n=1 Tax=Penicillium lagena TaxID=94218 RepID=UPI002540B498|nr:uncharacterized protein N7510_007532 [Penicillium lagena]KAJ5610813.1 hypothetical protein N7510_007532 [Penicillium lagena]